MIQNIMTKMFYLKVVLVIKIHDSPDLSQDTLNDVDMILSPREILQILVKCCNKSIARVEETFD